MTTSTFIITLLAIVCTGAKSDPTYEDSFSIEYGNFLFGNPTFDILAVDQMRLAYGLWTTSNKMCKVTQDTHSFHRPTKSKSCNVTLSTSDENDKLYNGRVALLDDDAVLILAKTGQNLLLANVQLNSCQTFRTTLPDQSENNLDVSVVPDENTYDVIHMNPAICGARRCKITFDYKDGRILKNTTAWGPVILDGKLEDEQLQDESVQTVVTRSSRKGHLLREHYFFQKEKVYLVRENESILLFSTKNDDDLVTTSTANDKIGMCSVTYVYFQKPEELTYKDYSLQCKQYDHDGRLVKLNMTIPMDDDEVAIMAMHNLVDGFLLLTSCPSRGDTYSPCYRLEASYRLLRFDGNGKEVKSIRLHRFYCNEGRQLAAQFFENDAGQYCISRICGDGLSWGKSNRFSMYVRCFDNSDL